MWSPGQDHTARERESCGLKPGSRQAKDKVAGEEVSAEVQWFPVSSHIRRGKDQWPVGHITVEREGKLSIALVLTQPLMNSVASLSLSALLCEMD